MTEYLLPSEIPHEILIKSQEATNPDYGKPPSERSVPELLENGVIFLDKPSGPTSHEVAAWLKRVMGIEKVGHGGTLDPKSPEFSPAPSGLKRPKRLRL